MQRLLREVGPGVMAPEHTAKFKQLYETGKLLEPEQ